MQAKINLTLNLSYSKEEHPTYDNAYVESGVLNGRNLTQLELDALNLSQVLIQILTENID